MNQPPLHGPVDQHGGMQRPSSLVVVSLVLTAIAIGWAVAGIGGNPADCVPACDCEVIGPGSVRQPINTWSALAIVAAGIWALITAQDRRHDCLFGAVVVLSGLAALAAHASVAAWAYRSDGAAIAALAWLAASLEWLGPKAAIPIATSATAAAWLLGAPASTWITAGAVAAFLAAQPSKRPTRRMLPGIAAATLLGVGLALRALTDDGGPWCRPEAPFPGHAIWHITAAVGLVCLVLYLRSGPVVSDSPEGHLRSGTATAPTGRD